jgi:hypothetical protein
MRSSSGGVPAFPISALRFDAYIPAGAARTATARIALKLLTLNLLASNLLAALIFFSSLTGFDDPAEGLVAAIALLELLLLTRLGFRPVSRGRCDSDYH